MELVAESTGHQQTLSGKLASGMTSVRAMVPELKGSSATSVLAAWGAL
jgi:hypothetical protein